MGCCTIRTSKHPVSVLTLASQTKELNVQREDLLSKIFFLHNLILNCNSRIENCLIENNKELAFLLKSKKIGIKAVSKEIQQLISRIDECLEDVQGNRSERDDIRNEVNKIEEELQNSPFYKDNSILDTNAEEYLKSLKSAINFSDINKKQVLDELDQEIEELKKKTSEQGSVIRRKYIKTRKSA